MHLCQPAIGVLRANTAIEVLACLDDLLDTYYNITWAFDLRAFAFLSIFLRS